ncbi:SDR family NAD(P)-dependent oxidoreductase [Amycolatopsis umgeniensis]|uniref:NAD(P)-dependent dehydrogenase (Short-subunit alcohol dehydrogenase family) n=1 Tax=Amycolatopsis umgeniensis TaxID=336628 RepID=A0A841ARN1_9PSEU|nr:SDR family NAD(P)-dependent oxidoreductase [Amycolatopsis umgeniensis]MBB5850556.1 NAD(P)-dependent dehydrogenase (short-subunit alcohol dehydrogenase family) [Amycolatopsis umgeniensis]
MAEQRTALVTGANRGLGQAVAAELSRRGLRVVPTTRRPGEAGGPQVLDVTDAESVRTAAEQVGEVDVLICNAGVLLDPGNDPLSVPLDLVERSLAVNLLGGWRVAQAFLPGMISRGWGRVVFVSSDAGSYDRGLFTGAPGYSVSKAALNGLTMMLASHAKGTGVLVNAVNPGPTRTRMMPMAERSAEESANEIADAATLADDGPSGVLLENGQPTPW